MEYYCCPCIWGAVCLYTGVLQKPTLLPNTLSGCDLFGDSAGDDMGRSVSGDLHMAKFGVSTFGILHDMPESKLVEMQVAMQGSHDLPA